MTIRVVDWDKEILHSSKDSSVGINIATLLESNNMGTYISIIPPGESVTPHYHKEGGEEYHVIDGEGMIRLLPVETGKKKFQLVCKQVKSRNSFIIPPNVIHQLINNGDRPLTFIFMCPKSHLKDDRFIIKNIEKILYENEQNIREFSYVHKIRCENR